MTSSEIIRSIKLDETATRFRTNADFNTAIRDLLGFNYFSVVEKNCGPYDVELALLDNKLVLNVCSGKKRFNFNLPMRSFRSIVRDYFMLLESHQQALSHGMLEKIEAIDMGRRGLHNEGAELIIDLLENKVNTDFETARRFFTIISILHMK